MPQFCPPLQEAAHACSVASIWVRGRIRVRCTLGSDRVGVRVGVGARVGVIDSHLCEQSSFLSQGARFLVRELVS